MKFSWILLVSGLCVSTYGGDTQQILGSTVDLFGTAYTCENGVKPSINCTDPSSESPNCSCTCTNGIAFNQTLSSTFPTDTMSGPSIDECQEDKTQCLTQQDEMRAQLDKQEQEHLLREQELEAELKKYQDGSFQYNGCYPDPKRNLLKAFNVQDQRYMTNSVCAAFCSKYRYYGVVYKACYCENSFQATPQQKLPDSRCEFDCPGEPGTKCGGTYTLSVYEKKT